MEPKPERVRISQYVVMVNFMSNRAGIQLCCDVVHVWTSRFYSSWRQGPSWQGEVFQARMRLPKEEAIHIITRHHTWLSGLLLCKIWASENKIFFFSFLRHDLCSWSWPWTHNTPLSASVCQILSKPMCTVALCWPCLQRVVADVCLHYVRMWHSDWLERRPMVNR